MIFMIFIWFVYIFMHYEYKYMFCNFIDIAIHKDRNNKI